MKCNLNWRYIIYKSLFMYIFGILTWLEPRWNFVQVTVIQPPTFVKLLDWNFQMEVPRQKCGMSRVIGSYEMSYWSRLPADRNHPASRIRRYSNYEASCVQIYNIHMSGQSDQNWVYNKDHSEIICHFCSHYNIICPVRTISEIHSLQGIFPITYHSS